MLLWWKRWKRFNTWIKKFENGRQEWEKAYIERGMQPQKINTFVKIIFSSKIIMFEETLEFKQSIIICYGKQNIATLQPRVQKAQMWAIEKVTTSCSNLVVIVCVMNQSCNHLLISNDLTTTNTLIVKL